MRATYPVKCGSGHDGRSWRGADMTGRHGKGRTCLAFLPGPRDPPPPLLGRRTLSRVVLPRKPPAPLPQAEGVPLLAERTPLRAVLPQRPSAPRPPESTTTTLRWSRQPPPRCLSLWRSWRESTHTCIWTAASPSCTGSDAEGGRCQICENTSYD